MFLDHLHPPANLVTVQRKDGEVFLGGVRVLRLFVARIIIPAKWIVSRKAAGVWHREMV